MATPAEIASSIRAQLRATDPDLDTTVGSVTRKIIDAVAESLAEFSAESLLIEYGYDIDTKFGADLDEFVELFGIARQLARRATGTVTFERSGPDSQDIVIPVGAQVATGAIPNMIASTVVPAILPAGDTAIDIPVQMVTGGSQGNISPGSITSLASTVQGIVGVTNANSFTGGRDTESDESLRLRFRATVFQNLSGTASQYLAVALQNVNVNNANVVGASKRYREQIQIVAGAGTSTVQDAKSIYPFSSTVGSNIDAGDILIEGVHYIFDATQNPPTVTSVDSEAMPNGVYDLTFSYEPNASRNDITNGITNRVDVYVSGEQILEGNDVRLFQTDKVFTNTTTDALYRQKFRREDGSVPVAGNYFVQYGFTPVVNPALGGFLTIGATTYTLGVNAFLANDITNEGLSFRSLSGIELVSEANGGPAAPTDQSVFVTSYAFNNVPRAVAEAIEQWRLLTQDIVVHAAKPIWLDLYFAVILEPGFSESGVRNELANNLERFIAQTGFATVLQTSDILSIASRTQGVDAIRFLTAGDNAVFYGIQRVANDRTTVLRVYADGNGRALDVISDDDELPLLNSITVDVRANNTFHIGQ
jgi:hypothetical protein